jgi:hypothetical protein
VDRLKKAIWQVGIGAGLIGLLFGYFGGRFFPGGKRRV